jgi:cob(I)alamin adenosyltransferase
MRINRLVTRTGDQGKTSLAGGLRVSKSSARVQAYGEVDELNSCLGLAVSLGLEPGLAALLEKVQDRLFSVGADLAAPLETSAPRVEEEHVTELEGLMESLMEELPPLKGFVLPGGGPAGSALHLARTVCRRAERSCVALADREPVTPQVLIYLNRLSDLLFVMAQVANRRSGHAETPLEFRSRRRGSSEG